MQIESFNIKYNYIFFLLQAGINISGNQNVVNKLNLFVNTQQVDKLIASNGLRMVVEHAIESLNA
jgi:hypothetical protein